MGLQGPPAVQVDVDGLPKADPAADRQSFADEAGQVRTRGDQVAQDQRRREEEQADQQRRPTFAEELSEVTTGDAGAIAEVMLDRLPDQPRGVGVFRLAQHDADAEVRIPFVLTRPAQDELFGVVVQVAFVEGRRVHGIEQLADVVEPEFDQAGGGVCHVQRGSGLPRAASKNRARFSRISFDSPAP